MNGDKKKKNPLKILSNSEDSERSSAELSEGEFIVDSIVDVRLAGRKFEYKVRWEGYGVDDDTWEPENTLTREGVKKILEEFKKSHAAKINELKDRKNRNSRKRQAPYEYMPVSRETAGKDALKNFYGEEVTREKKSLFDPNHKYTESEKFLSSLGHTQRISRNQMREMIATTSQYASLANYQIPKKKKPVQKSYSAPLLPPIEDTPLVIDDAVSSLRASPVVPYNDPIDDIGSLDHSPDSIAQSLASPPMEKKEQRPPVVLSPASPPLIKEKMSDPVANNNTTVCPQSKEKKEDSVKKNRVDKVNVPLVTSAPPRRFEIQSSEPKSKSSKEKDRKNSRISSPPRDKSRNSRLDKYNPVGSRDNTDRVDRKQHWNRSYDGRPVREEARPPTVEEFIALCKLMDSAKLLQVRQTVDQNQFTDLCVLRFNNMGLNVLHWLPLEGGCRGKDHHPADEIAWIIGRSCGPTLFQQQDINGRTPLHYAVLYKKECLVSCYIELGSPINARDRMGQTALMLAIAQNQRHVVTLLLKAGASFDNLMYPLVGANDHDCKRLVETHERVIERALLEDPGLTMIRDVQRISPIFVSPLVDGTDFFFQFHLSRLPPQPTPHHTAVLAIFIIGRDEAKWSTQSYPRIRMLQVPLVNRIPVFDYQNTPMMYPCNLSLDINEIFIRLGPETIMRQNAMIACLICTGIYKYPQYPPLR